MDTVGQSSRPCKWTGAHLYVSRASDLFVQCKMHYISYIGVVTPGWMIYIGKGVMGCQMIMMIML